MTGLLLLAAFVAGASLWAFLHWLDNKITPHFRVAGSPESLSPGCSVEDREQGAPVDAHTPGASTGGTPTTTKWVGHSKVTHLQPGDYMPFYGASVRGAPTPGINYRGEHGVFVPVRLDNGAQNNPFFPLGEWVEVEREADAA